MKLADLTWVVMIDVFAADNIDGVTKPAKVDEAKVDGEKQSASDQPHDNQRHLRSKYIDREEDEIFGGVGHGPHCTVDYLIE